MERRQNPDVLLRTLSLAGRRVVDVGCGQGHLCRLMAAEGAHVLGIEVNAGQLAAARAAEPAGDETYASGVAEALPLEDACVDVVVMSNSLHHVPPDRQGAALGEAARVLVPGGLLYVSEPVAEGSHFDLMRPVHDETDVRARAYEELGGAGRFGLETVSETVHLHTVTHADYDGFRARITGINPETAPAFEAHDTELRDAFERLGRPSDGGRQFDQPTRVTLLRKRAG